MAGFVIYLNNREMGIVILDPVYRERVDIMAVDGTRSSVRGTRYIRRVDFVQSKGESMHVVVITCPGSIAQGTITGGAMKGS